MPEMISYCGLPCHTCPIHTATLEQDAEKQAVMRSEIARLCREQYGLNYELKDITDCDGCRTIGGRLFSGCKDCRVRDCAQQRGVEHCGTCPNYPCSQLELFFSKDRNARTRLDSLRNNPR